jgi:hypothetical protein
MPKPAAALPVPAEQLAELCTWLRWRQTISQTLTQPVQTLRQPVQYFANEH